MRIHTAQSGLLALALAAGTPLAGLAQQGDGKTKVDGITFPHKIQRSTGGVTDEAWTVTKVKVHPTVDPKKFLAKS